MHAYMTSDSDDHVQREKRLQLVKMKGKKTGRISKQGGVGIK